MRLRAWLIEQVRELLSRAEVERTERGEFAHGMVDGAADAYARAGRMFGLLTGDEIRKLIPKRFLEHAWLTSPMERGGRAGSARCAYQ